MSWRFASVALVEAAKTLGRMVAGAAIVAAMLGVPFSAALYFGLPPGAIGIAVAVWIIVALAVAQGVCAAIAASAANNAVGQIDEE